MTLAGWIRRAMGYSDPSANAEVVEKIEREKAKLNGAAQALSREVAVLRSQRERGAAISGLLDDALRSLNRRDLR